MSNSNSWAQVMGPVLAHQKQICLRETWGHLAPEKNTSYKIDILFCYTEYGNLGTVLIDTKLGNGLEDSPWLYDAINDYIQSFEVPSGVYIISGTFRNFRFYGRPQAQTTFTEE